MAQYTGTDELNGLFKNVYGEDGPVDLIPEVGMLYQKLKLRDTERIGAQYIIDVIVANSHGFTYNTSSNTAFSLNNHIAMTTAPATITAAELVLRDAIAYRAASRSSGGNKKAFKDATELVVKNMYDSHVKRLEISMWYGGQGIGVLTNTNQTNVDSTHETCTLDTASWAPGIWAGLENAQIEFRKVSDGTLLSSGADAIFVVQKVDNDNKKITVTGTSTGITALDGISVAYNVWFYGSNANEMTGARGILANSGSLFGIDAGTYGLWKANSYDCGSAQLTISKVIKGMSKAYSRGLMGKSMLAVNPLGWANLASDLAGLRKYDGSYRRQKAENGFESITFYAQSGEVEIVGYNLIKEGEAMAFPLDRVHRIGSTDVTFNTPGMGGKIFTQLANNAGFELRNYSDSAIFIETPARCVLFKNIVNVA